MPIARIRYLVARYLNGACTPQEQHELFEWINRSQQDDMLKAALEDVWHTYQPEGQMPEIMSDRILNNVFKETPVLRPVKRGRPSPVIWWAAAASVVVLACTGIYLWQPPVEKQVAAAPREQRFRNEVQPGGNKALLTLADGTVIELDSAGTGVLATQGSVQVKKLANGQLVYQEVDGNSLQPGTNTMSTPRGGSYKITLPDGTQVWLNASSSITYPTVFTGGERVVSISGEAYFEVAQNAQQPFKVSTRGMEVQILGTSFNINAYDDEPSVRTTLLEGSVKVVAGGQSTPPIQPGQQAKLTSNGLTVINDVNTDETIAWKNGYFQFTDADMATVMRQLEKWYDVEVIYEGQIPKRSFGGGMQRTLPLTKVLDILEENDVQFRIEGKKIIVMK
ncbi:FecR family protein [uncultured Chitinophaga sp.]|uniref:FecR family protein n=1 Tax=uncultured Chitinophaga sp. TaxID=339340 RepID=UPI0025EDB145|nr:FecR family protein [uncultured Chitinophaga sp.]